MGKAVTTIAAAPEAERPLLVCDNGGSSADAQHIATNSSADFLKEREAYNVIELGTDTAVATARSTDSTFESLFAREVEDRLAGAAT